MNRLPSTEATYRVTAAVVWVAMWTGAALILRGHSREFGDMIPLLAAGSAIGLALPGQTGLRAYLIGSLVIWISLLAGTALVLGGTPYLWGMVWLLGAGAFCLLVVMPVYLTFLPPPSKR